MFWMDGRMKSFWTVLMVLMATPAVAQESDRTWTLGGYSDLGIMVKPGDPDVERTDMVGSIGLGLLVDFDVSEHVRVGFGLGAPTIEAWTVSIPLSVRYHPWGWAQSGLYFQGQLTPQVTLGTPCAWRDGCEVPYPNIDDGRLYRAIGAAAKGGLGFQINWTSVWFFMDTAINSGYFVGLETSDGHALSDGLYFGGEMTLGLRFPL